MIGKKLGGRYEILERVGGGGMAVVYKAKDVLLDRVVALKILRPQYAIDDDFVNRFRREAQAVASLSHANIVSIYDVGIENDVHYIVMEYIEGPTLKEYISKHAPLHVHEAIDITKQIAEALDHAHSNEIIHRDIKPHNILIGRNQRIKVTDFGIARAVSSSTITHTGSVMGSVHYFSPEQARGGMTGEKSDIYSLGIVLYEMLTGELPYSGESPISIALKHLQETFTDPRELNGNIPQSVENIILKSLAKDPLKRYDSARALIDDLDTCLHSSRLNEPKIDMEDDDYEEATKVIPAINEDMFETKVINRSKRHGDEDGEDDEWPDEQSEKPKRSIWFKLGMVALTLIIIGVAAFLLVKFVSQLFYVPEVEVEDVLDWHIDDAVALFEDELGLRVEITRTHSDSVERDHIMRQIPVAGNTVKEGSTVRLTVSDGKRPVSMPNVIGLSMTQAESILAAFEPEYKHEYNEEEAPGIIFDQTPGPQDSVIPGETEVIIWVSKGKETVEIPEIRGKTEAEAKGMLERLNIAVADTTYEYHERYGEGIVYDTWPHRVGSEISVGDQLRLFVSKGLKYKEINRQINVSVPERKKEDDDDDEEPQPEPVKVRIVVNDVNGEQTVINESISEAKSYTVTVKVSRERGATITVFRDDERYHTETVQFGD